MTRVDSFAFELSDKSQPFFYKIEAALPDFFKKERFYMLGVRYGADNTIYKGDSSLLYQLFVADLNWASNLNCGPITIYQMDVTGFKDKSPYTQTITPLLISSGWFTNHLQLVFRDNTDRIMIQLVPAFISCDADTGAQTMISSDGSTEQISAFSSLTSAPFYSSLMNSIRFETKTFGRFCYDSSATRSSPFCNIKQVAIQSIAKQTFNYVAQATGIFYEGNDQAKTGDYLSSITNGVGKTSL